MVALLVLKLLAGITVGAFAVLGAWFAATVYAAR
jgi:hypothetical protein